MPNATTVVEACEEHWGAYKSDCSGFVRAVARELGVTLSGQANDIVDQMETGPWSELANGLEARDKATTGYFVLAALEDDPHGHVAVVVPGELNRGKYPTAYWGSLGSTGRKAATINWCWDRTDRDKVTYAYYTSKVFV
jgi:cell wall-associated NlpC family hydrolase